MSTSITFESRVRAWMVERAEVAIVRRAHRDDDPILIESGVDPDALAEAAADHFELVAVDASLDLWALALEVVDQLHRFPPGLARRSA